MIAVRINGGLGNQMLQYAAGRSLSLERSTDLELDTYQFDIDLFAPAETRRQFSLSVFPALRSIPRLSLLPVDFLASLPTLRRQVYLSYAKRCFPGQRLRCFDGYRTDDIEGFFRLPDRSYLTGHYFSERFFLPYEREIRRDFAFPPVEDPANQNILAQIRGGTSVSVHVRRTDYLHAASANFASVCDLPYYERGITHFETVFSASAHYFVFSDDPGWAAIHLPLPPGRFTIVEHNTGERAFEDMRLMSNCKHHLIANSTFSWWGAWLNEHPDKVVIAPRQWYREYTGSSEELIVPGEWLRV